MKGLRGSQVSSILLFRVAGRTGAPLSLRSWPPSSLSSNCTLLLPPQPPLPFRFCTMASRGAGKRIGKGRSMDNSKAGNDLKATASKSMWVPKAPVSTSTEKAARSAAVVEAPTETAAYPVKKGQMKVQAQIRATFYPKFENEKSDQEIRTRMIEVVAAGNGILEVTLKHSGSLFMYSGDDGGAFAKNSYGNLYTAVGVYVLGKTLQQAWGDQSAKKQRDFNTYLKKNKICISMELVTAVLGDHGQRPLHDYVVVTAVTELGKGRPKFYSTPDLIQFCREWRLPTNHVWLFSTRESASACFAAYDALCEEGVYSTVCKTMDEIANTSVPASESHDIVQGDILEGLVARVVSPESVKRLKKVLETHPMPKFPPATFIAPGLREICAANRQSEQDQVKALLKAVGSDFCTEWDDWFKKNTEGGNSHLNQFLELPPADEPTARLQDMVKLLRSKHMNVRFKCQTTDKESGDLNFKMTIHVLNDSVFRRYQREMGNNPNLWPLYRGFFVDIKVVRDSGTSGVTNAMQNMRIEESVEQDMLADDAEHLMVKLKFLTYKIRTFLIRNGIQTLFTKGHHAYKEYYLKQMKIWNTSPEKKRHMSQLLDEWAEFITTKIKTGRLDTNTYLSVAEPFLKRFADRNPRNRRLVGSAGSTVQTEDFIAAAHDAEDEEGDLRRTDEAPKTPAPVKAKGLLVFFPGIPGCAKSALCKEILSTKGGLGDGRTMKSLMGDMIKGRYWQKVAEDRTKNPNIITLADKNAPNYDVWKQIQEISQSTDALAVPVIPDSEGTDSNPFSLDALAVFIYRVLQRENHPGNLDKNSKNVGYVLLMFYHLYEGKDRSDFEADLENQFGKLVKAPLLKKERPPLPESLRKVLEEGIQLYQKHSAKHGKADPAKGSFATQWVQFETKLRTTLLQNESYIKQIQVPFEEVVESVRQQLRGIAAGEYELHISSADERKQQQAFNYAAVTLSKEDVLAALQKLKEVDGKAKAFLETKLKEAMMKGAHVTLAHKRSHGVPAVASYAAYTGCHVSVQLTSLLFAPHLCALEANIVHDAVKSKNPWSHVTVWTAPNVPPKEAATLPSLVSKGQGSRIDFPQPVTLDGKVQFMT